MRYLKLQRVIGLMTLAAVVEACSDTATEPVLPPAAAGSVASIVHLSGNNQTGFPGAAIQPLAVRVADSFNNPVAGASVRFEVTGGNGSIDGAAVTGVDGIATSTAWVLGESGVNRVVASAGGVSSEPFSAFALGVNTQFVLERVDDRLVAVGNQIGHVILSSDGGFAAEHKFTAFGTTTFAGRGRFELSAQEIVLRITDGEWLLWADAAGGQRTVHGQIVHDTLELTFSITSIDDFDGATWTRSIRCTYRRRE